MRGSAIGSLVLVLAGLMVAACASPSLEAGSATPEIYREQEFSWIGESPEQIIDRAEAIVIGQVVSFSPSAWNQDSGEYWEDETSQMTTLQYFEVTVNVLEVVVDEIGLGNEAVVTVLGPSPADHRAGADSGSDPRGVQRSQVGDISFETGGKVLLFLARAPMAWRGGVLEKVMLVGGPQGKYTLTDDGQALNTDSPGRDTTLEALLEEISARRKVGP